MRLFAVAACTVNTELLLGSAGGRLGGRCCGGALEGGAVDGQALARKLGRIFFAYTFDARDEVVPVLEVALFALVKNLAGHRWADAFDAVEFGLCGLVHIDRGKTDGSVQKGDDDQYFFQHDSTPEG